MFFDNLKMYTAKNDAQNLNNIIENEQIYCICRSPTCSDFMIMCDICKEWFHGDCIGVTLEESDRIDMYCCNGCEKNNPMIRTTFKLGAVKKGKKKKRRGGIPSKRALTSGCAVTQSGKENEAVVNQNFFNSSSFEVPPSVSSFGFIDTTIRKAKTNAYQKLKDTSEAQLPKEKPKRSKTENMPLRQCYGPGCTKPSRKGSKYCSDVCGEALAKNRILEILPQRLKQWMSIPSVADEFSRKKVNDIRARLAEVERQLEAVDMKIIQLIDQIQQWKNPGNVFIELPGDDTILNIDCALCGMEIQNKSIERHLEQCYRRQEARIYITETTGRPNDMRWNVFCNHKISENLYCKKLRVLCPQHYKDCRKPGEVCGHILGEFNDVTKYCGNVGRTCNHVNWEDRLRAELDLEKLNLILKYNRLMKEKAKIRSEMSARGNLMGLMLHETIVH